MRLQKNGKLFLGIVTVLAVFLLAAGTGYSSGADAQVDLSSPAAYQVYKPGDRVEIAGAAQNLSEISIVVHNEQGVLQYAAQPKIVNSAFSVSFKLEGDASEGRYTISISGLGLPGVQRYWFEVDSAGGAVVELEQPAAGASFDAGDVVEIAGRAQKIDQLVISVRNSKNGRVYIAQPTVTDGRFAARFTLAAGSIAGTYSITVTGAGLDAPQTRAFAVTSSGNPDDPGNGPGQPGDVDPNDDLFIRGNGVNHEISFSLDELNAMYQRRAVFSGINAWPQNVTVAAEGVPLRTLLEQAGITSRARIISFTGSDGYRIDFTVDELLDTPRYAFPGGREVEPLIALRRVEGSDDYGDMTTDSTPVLCYGQRAPSEQTIMGFVKYLRTIRVTTDSPGRWSQPKASIMAPGSSKKTATKGGAVESGSQVVLESELRTNVYYTTDGSEPDLNSSIYNVSLHVPSLNVPIPVNANTTIKARTVGRGKEDSEVLTLNFTVEGAPAPVAGGAVPQQAVDESNIKREEITLGDGRKGEQITLLPGALADIEKAASGSRLTVTAATAAGQVDQVILAVPAGLVQKAREKDMSLGLDSGIANYTLPIKDLDLGGIAAQWGVALEELNLRVVIDRAAGEVRDRLAARLREGQQMLAEPVEFRVEITAPDGRTTTYNSFGSAYAVRELALGSGFNAGRATGVVWREEGGGFIPLPTRFSARNGQNFAAILNRNNSLYTVVQSEKTFSDIQNSWAKGDIELLASKMLIGGKSETAYEPGSSITRAEFAALLVRGLGLPEAQLKESRFKDVAGADWYAGSVAVAVNENIVSGYEGSLFKPGGSITREEMAAMLIRAARAAGVRETITAEEQEQRLARFKDRQSIASWAAPDVALAVKAGIISGLPGEEFAPRANADRAQSAAMLKRFLTYINFISF